MLCVSLYMKIKFSYINFKFIPLNRAHKITILLFVIAYGATETEKQNKNKSSLIKSQKANFQIGNEIKKNEIEKRKGREKEEQKKIIAFN